MSDIPGHPRPVRESSCPTWSFLPVAWFLPDWRFPFLRLRLRSSSPWPPFILSLGRDVSGSAEPVASVIRAGHRAPSQVFTHGRDSTVCSLVVFLRPEPVVLFRWTRQSRGACFSPLGIRLPMKQASQETLRNLSSVYSSLTSCSIRVEVKLQISGLFLVLGP